MKGCLITFALTLSLCSLNSGNEYGLFSKIENQELITKSELESFLNFKFTEYEENFIGTGSALSSGEIKTGIVQGKKNDTIFDVLIVFKGNKRIAIREHPNSSFYRKGETICREYALGGIYADFKTGDTTCIVSFIETLRPFKVDTLKFKFYTELTSVIHRDTLEFCSNKK